MTGHVPAGTIVKIRVTETFSSQGKWAGDPFTLELAEPIAAAGGIVVPAGAKGQGEVISRGKAGSGGQAGKLVLAARYLEFRDQRIPLRSLRLTAVGDDYNDIRRAAMSAIVFEPGFGVVAAVVEGDEAVIREGTVAEARLANDLTLPVVVPGAAQSAPSDTMPSHVLPLNEVGAPPTGKGLVVFYRFGGGFGGSRLTVMEGDTAITSLGNKTYFVLPVDRGSHIFRANDKEGADTLTIEVEAGETHYVREDALSAGIPSVGILYPSTEQAFISLPKAKLAPAGRGKKGRS